MASPEHLDLRFWRGRDVVGDVLKNAAGPVGSSELGRTGSLLVGLLYILVGMAVRKAPWITAQRCEGIRSITFKVLFPIYLLRTLWAINMSLGLAIIAPLSCVFHLLWFFVSQQLATFTPEAAEVQAESGQPYICLAGWALLISQGENMAFTYPLLAEASSPVEALASAMMWDLGANIWLCQGFLWGIATLYSPQVQAGAYTQICSSATCDTEEGTDLFEAEKLGKTGNWLSRLPTGAKDVAVKAVTSSILLRACLLGVCLNLFQVPLPWILDAGLLRVGSLCKGLLYILVGLYADSNLSIADFRFIAATLSQRFLAQIIIVLLVFAAPMPSIASRNAVVVTIFSPGPSVLMHILAEVGYGEHLVKLCVTSSLVNTVLCLIIQTTLLEYLPG